MSEQEVEQALRGSIRRLNARVQGVVFGLLTGAGLFLATVILVLRGGEAVGPHLALLAYYFPGYTVTWGGAVLGLLYGFACGYLAGYTMAAIYNVLSRRQRGN